MFLLSPKPSLKALLVGVVILHFAIQILSSQYYSIEIPALAGLVYVGSGSLCLLSASHLVKKATQQKSRQALTMGAGVWLLGLTHLLAGLGLVGLFGPVSPENINLAYYLFVFGFGITGILFHQSYRDTRIRGVSHLLIAGTFIMIVGVVALYRFHAFLPPLYTVALGSTFVRQQLMTLVLILYCTASARYAISYWEKSSKAWHWFVISLGIMGLAMPDFILSQHPGDPYSWAGRFMVLAAAVGLIQYRWWDEQEG
jgi:uncharacterized membrane protein YidH (DUF202 family)